MIPAIGRDGVIPAIERDGVIPAIGRDWERWGDTSYRERFIDTFIPSCI